MTRYFVTGGSGFVGRHLITALRARGDEVVALARSDGSVRAVEAGGATAARGDLDDVDAMARGMAGCTGVFHCAAHVSQEGTREEFIRGNVTGTENTLNAAIRAGVKRFVHVSTEAVLVGERPLHNADETAPYPRVHPFLYGETKRLAEDRVRAATGIEAMIVRPRFIWGKGDSTLLPQITAMVRAGKFAWIGGGRYLTSTSHVRNVAEGMIAAMEKGRSGETYFLTDGEPVEFRTFITDMLATQGLAAPSSSVPRGLAMLGARVLEGVWKIGGLKGNPPLTTTVLKLTGETVTVSDAKARRELGYTGKVTREEGLREMKV